MCSTEHYTNCILYSTLYRTAFLLACSLVQKSNHISTIHNSEATVAKVVILGKFDEVSRETEVWGPSDTYPEKPSGS